MSKRKWRPRGVTCSSDEDEAAAPRPPRASRKAGLQLSQSTAGSGGSGTSSALAALLGSKPAAAASGAAGSAGAAPAATTAAAASATVAARRPRVPSRGRAAAAKTAAATTAAASSQAPQVVGPAPGQLWVEQYAPRAEEELVVHKKKVQEVRAWLQEQNDTLGCPGKRRLLVLSGPPGCGKSSVLSALAPHLGFELSEWRPPSVVGWDEAQHAGIQTRSKLDEFGEFVARAKMPHLSLTGSGASSSSRPGGSGSGASSQPTQPTAVASARSSQPSAAAAAPAAVGGGSAHAGPGSSQACGGGVRPGRLPPSLLPTLVVVDDLPHASSAEQRRQIADALADLASGARFPVVVVATETSGKASQEKGLSAAAGTFQGLHKELISVLEKHDASAIHFNAFTLLNIAKALRAILQNERRSLPEPDLLAIAEQANGDLYNAISTLQFVCTGAAAAPQPAKPARGRGGKRKAPAAAASGGAEAASGERQASGVGYASRDSSLSLFHALGKLLYNKRHLIPAGQRTYGGGLPPTAGQRPASASTQPATPSEPQQQPQQQQQQQAATPPLVKEEPAAADSKTTARAQPWNAHRFWQQALGGGSQLGLRVAAWTQRRPMEFDPEAVLAAAGLGAGSVAAFLHENLLSFIDGDAIADVAGCLEQLSAADALASGRRWGTNDALMEDDCDASSPSLLDAAAASVAARGICFHNVHPAPRSFLPLRAPSVFAAAKGQAANAAELSCSTAPSWAVQGGTGCLEPAGRLAAELLPFARAIAQHSRDPALQRLQPARWARFWNGQLHQQQAAGAGDWRQEQEEGVGATQPAEQQQQQLDDTIEESEDDDDW